MRVAGAETGGVDARQGEDKQKEKAETTIKDRRMAHRTLPRLVMVQGIPMNLEFC